MRTRHKVAVIGIFFLGCFTTVTGIIRLHFLSYAYASLKEPLFNDVDCTSFQKSLHSRHFYSPLTLNKDNYAPAFYWSIIETNTGIVSACLPTLRPLFAAYPVVSSVSKFFKSLSSGIRSTRDPSTDIRLNSMEQGLTETQSKALNVHQNKAYAVYDESKPAHPGGTGIMYESTYSVSDRSPNRV